MNPDWLQIDAIIVIKMNHPVFNIHTFMISLHGLQVSVNFNDAVFTKRKYHSSPTARCKS